MFSRGSPGRPGRASGTHGSVSISHALPPNHRTGGREAGAWFCPGVRSVVRPFTGAKSGVVSCVVMLQIARSRATRRRWRSKADSRKYQTSGASLAEPGELQKSSVALAVPPQGRPRWSRTGTATLRDRTGRRRGSSSSLACGQGAGAEGVVGKQEPRNGEVLDAKTDRLRSTVGRRPMWLSSGSSSAATPRPDLDADAGQKVCAAMGIVRLGDLESGIAYALRQA